MKRLLCLFLILTLSLPGVLAEEASVSKNPLVTPLEAIPVTRTADLFVNFLFLGIDHGYKANSTIAYKEDIQECHTDAVLLVSLNLDKHKLSLVSLPRDSLTYVPGVKGVYKLNSAVNCAPTLEEGFEKTAQAVSWHLGGIPVHGYIAVDVPAMVALGDAIGGVDFDLDMSYGGEGRFYKEGFQHLDGQGIMDYVRARKNATKGSNDLGRNDRQRRMIQAIISKIRREPLLINSAVDAVLSGELNIFTNIKLGDAAAFAAGSAADRRSVPGILREAVSVSLRKAFLFPDPGRSAGPGRAGRALRGSQRTSDPGEYPLPGICPPQGKRAFLPARGCTGTL